MIMAEMAAFDNIEELAAMADDLATFVRQAAVEGTAAHEIEPPKTWSKRSFENAPHLGGKKRPNRWPDTNAFGRA